MFEKFKAMCKEKKGVAGLTVLLSVVSMLFVIGIIVMAYQLTGSKLKASTTDADAIEVINETMLSLKGTTDYFPIYITIAGIVVIVLLIVIIFQALRGSGIMGGGGA